MSSTASGVRTGLAARLLAATAVVVVTVAGIWVTGALITNDFTLAMALTAAWMGVGGLACAAIAWRSRALRVPVLGAYVLTAAVVSILLGRSLVLDDEVNERVARVAPPARAGADRPAGPARPRNVLLGQGSFRPLAHAARGRASAIRLARGGRVLTLTSFEVDNGPDLRVLLVPGPARSEAEVKDYVDLGALKGNEGDQQYAVPADVDLRRPTTAVIWCRAFSVAFARAPL